MQSLVTYKVGIMYANVLRSLNALSHLYYTNRRFGHGWNVTYCNGKRDGLGYKFAGAAHEYFASIAQSPDAFAERYKNVRGKLIKTVPYLILHNIIPG